MKDVSRTVAVALAAAVSVTACFSARRGDPVGRPVRVQSTAEQRGAIAFDRQCHHCHPGGAAGLGPAINNKPLPEFLIRTQVRQGLGAMPAFAEEVLPDDELDDIVAWLQAARRADGTPREGAAD